MGGSEFYFPLPFFFSVCLGCVVRGAAAVGEYMLTVTFFYLDLGIR